MSEFTDFLVYGVSIGAIYALMAMPMTLIWRSTDVVDIATGGYAVVAGIIAASMGGVLGCLVGLTVAMVIGAGTGAIFVGFSRLQPSRETMPIVLATFGVSLVIQSAVLSYVGTDNLYLPRISGRLSVASLNIPVQGLVNLAVAFLLFIILKAILDGTPVGLRLRAAALSPSSASLVGIAVRRTQFWMFVAGSGIAGTVGLLAAMTVGISYQRGLFFTLAAFSATIVLGLRGPGTALLGGIVLGVCESLGTGYLPDGWGAGISSVLVAAVLISGRLHRVGAVEMRA